MLAVVEHTAWTLQITDHAEVNLRILHRYQPQQAKVMKEREKQKMTHLSVVMDQPIGSAHPISSGLKKETDL